MVVLKDLMISRTEKEKGGRLATGNRYDLMELAGAFGDRTGGALVFFGSIVILVALFFGDGVNTLFQLFPLAILDVILFIAGAELALTARPEGSITSLQYNGACTNPLVFTVAVWLTP